MLIMLANSCQNIWASFRISNFLNDCQLVFPIKELSILALLQIMADATRTLHARLVAFQEGKIGLIGPLGIFFLVKGGSQ